MNKNFNPTEILQTSLNELECEGILLALSEKGVIETFSAGSISAGIDGKPFHWLHIDFESLAKLSRHEGWDSERIVKDEDGHFFAA